MTKFYEDPDRFGYNRAEIFVESGQFSPPLIVDVIYNAMTVAVIPTGRAKAQFTICSISDIQINNAVWFDWDISETNEASADTIYGVVTAIRLNSLYGQAAMKVVAR